MQRMCDHSNRRHLVYPARGDGCKRHLASVHFLVFHTHCCILLFLPSLSSEIFLAKIGGMLCIDLCYYVLRFFFLYFFIIKYLKSFYCLDQII